MSSPGSVTTLPESGAVNRKTWGVMFVPDTTATGMNPPIRHDRDVVEALPESLTTTLYAYAAGRESVSLEELLMATESPVNAARRAIEQLLAMRLLRPTVDVADHFVAVAPATAGAQVLLPAIRQLREQQSLINEACAELTALLPVYETSTLSRFEDQAFQSLTDLSAVRQTITELSARAQEEVLTSHPGGARPEAVLKESEDRTTQLLRRGVRMRTIYQHAAQFSQHTVRHVHTLVGLGAEIRTVRDAFMRLIVFDRSTAVVELRDNPQGALVVRDPSLVDFAVAAFERTWADAVAFPLAYERDRVLNASEELKLALIRLLVEGHEDKVIAKRLGISLRTYQRHLSDVMKRIGARNRFHAGYLIRELKILDVLE